MNEQIKTQIDAKLALYKRQGLPAATAQSLIQDEFGVQIQLNPTEPQASSVHPAGSDLHALTRAVVSGLEIYDLKREAARLESQTVELEQAEKAEFREELASIKQAVMGTAGGLASHLVQHQMQAQGQLEALDPGASLKFLLDGLDPKARADLVKRLAPEVREALEAAERGDTPALPQVTTQDEPKVIEVKRRGLFGLGG
jgi:hypothetical protein